MSLAINTADGPINLLCAYTPTLAASAEVKDAFYSQLDSLIQGISRRDNLIILGDFNARVGSDNEAWPNCLGNFGVGKCNDNGQRLLELCSFQELCVTNTFFCTKKHYRVSWRHLRSKHWHQLDLIITRRRFLQGFIITRAYHSAVQHASDTGNIKATYDGIKKAVGPTIFKSAPLKSKSGDIISDKNKKLERWVEHYSELYSRENTVSQSPLDAINVLQLCRSLMTPHFLKMSQKKLINFFQAKTAFQGK